MSENNLTLFPSPDALEAFARRGRQSALTSAPAVARFVTAALGAAAGAAVQQRFVANRRAREARRAGAAGLPLKEPWEEALPPHASGAERLRAKREYERDQLRSHTAAANANASASGNASVKASILVLRSAGSVLASTAEGVEEEENSGNCGATAAEVDMGMPVFPRLSVLNLSINHIASEHALVGLGVLRALRWVDVRGNVFNAAINTQLHSRLPPLAVAFPVLARFVVQQAGASLVVANPRPAPAPGQENDHIMVPGRTSRTAALPAQSRSQQQQLVHDDWLAADPGSAPLTAPGTAGRRGGSAASAAAAPAAPENARWTVPAQSRVGTTGTVTVSSHPNNTGVLTNYDSGRTSGVVAGSGAAHTKGGASGAADELRYMLAAGSADVSGLLAGSPYAAVLVQADAEDEQRWRMQRAGALPPQPRGAVTTAQLRASLRPHVPPAVRGARAAERHQRQQHKQLQQQRQRQQQRGLATAGENALAFTPAAGRAEATAAAVAARAATTGRFANSASMSASTASLGSGAGRAALYARVDAAVDSLDAALRSADTAQGYVGGNAAAAAVLPQHTQTVRARARGVGSDHGHGQHGHSRLEALGLRESVQCAGGDPADSGVFVSRQMARAEERREKEKRAHDVEILLRTVNTALAESLWGQDAQ